MGVAAPALMAGIGQAFAAGAITSATFYTIFTELVLTGLRFADENGEAWSVEEVGE